MVLPAGESELAGHASQSSVPRAALNVPLGHWLHDPDALALPVMVPWNPTSHRQSSAWSEPSTLSELEGQASHAAAEKAFLKVFAGQVVHTPGYEAHNREGDVSVGLTRMQASADTNDKEQRPHCS